MTFGATDMPLKAEELEEVRPGPVPDRASAAMVPVVNLEGIKPGDLTLDGPTLAKIFLGEIKTWNDPAIAKLNPSAKLPAQPIVVVHRSDGSGTTFIWTDYLSKVSPEWKAKVGANTAVEWPVGIGAKGNEGVANNVGQTKGSIGYVEYAYAKQNKLNYAKHDQQGRQDRRTDHRSRSRRQRASADWAKARPASSVILTDEPGAGSWPIAGATFILIHKQPADPAARDRGAQVLRLGLRQGRQDGRGPRLRADAGQCRHRHPEGLVGGDQGRVRQAAVHGHAIDCGCAGEGAARRLLSASVPRSRTMPCVAAPLAA